MFAHLLKPELAFPNHGRRAALGLLCLIGLAFGDPAAAQIASPVVNISPVNSDRDNSNPNSASGGRVNSLAAHPSNDQIYFAASEWGGSLSAPPTAAGTGPMCPATCLR